MGVSDDNWWSKNTSTRRSQEKLRRSTSTQTLQRRLPWIQVSDCNGNCGAEYKYQIATETAERNTSKQVSAKETALRNVYKYSRINFIFYFILFYFIFWSGMNLGKRSQKVSRRYFRVVMALVWRDIGDGNHWVVLLHVLVPLLVTIRSRCQYLHIPAIWPCRAVCMPSNGQSWSRLFWRSRILVLRRWLPVLVEVRSAAGRCWV